MTLDHSALALLGIFAAIVAVLLIVDIRSHAGNKPVSLGNAGLWSGIWVGTSLAFAGIVWLIRGPDAATLFGAGYVLEKVLSVDNLIVFGSIFAYFRIPPEYQHKVLHYGVIGAVVFRLIFVALGMGSLALFGPYVEGLMAALVAWSAWQMFRGMGTDDDAEIDHNKRWYIRWTRQFLVIDSQDLADGLFYEKIVTANTGRKIIIWNRLILCLVAVEVCDVLFAFDSVPAVIAVTQDAVLVYSAMIFAIMGLRSMYFVLAALQRFLAHMDKAVLVVLLFIAAKLALHATGLYSIGPVDSLIIVVSVLSIGVVASLAANEVAKVS